MGLLLYYAPTACSLVPYITLTEAGADFDVRPVNLRQGEHRAAEFRGINPKQAVPVLAIDGEPLTENVAIQIWIARNFPKAKLLPSDPMEEIRAIAFLSWCASGIHPRLTPNFAPQRYCDVPGSEDSVRRCAQKLLLGNYAIAEDMLADGREWFFNQFTAADAYFFWCFRRGMQFDIDLSMFVLCTAHFHRMVARASVQKLFSFEKAILDQFAKL
jgi:glutathione S-transferase